jgi:riboflavin synthase
MFTGIIETIGEIQQIKKDGNNIIFTIKSEISSELKIDQSLSHDGVCLTVIETTESSHSVVAIKETALKSNVKEWVIGSLVNLERAMKLGDRLDGHIVQGHVDQTAKCTKILEESGSWYFDFDYEESENITVSKGSISINGVSLTVVESGPGNFSVAIIPYTYEHTNFKKLNVGSTVNIEFDMIGKYIAKLIKKT